MAQPPGRGCPVGPLRVGRAAPQPPPQAELPLGRGLVLALPALRCQPAAAEAILAGRELLAEAAPR
eukprot:12114192-Alexandrium_andersonii.AAC.1